MLERHITRDDIVSTVKHGEVIEDYPHDTPCPSRLLMAWIGTRCLHVVAARDIVADAEIIVTVYEPNNEEWNVDFKTRNQR